ncbi:13231_t:CDS:2, partial [Racocetra fulgida]
TVIPDKKDEIIEALVKQVQQLSVNYVAAMVDKRKQQVQPDTPEKRRRLQPESKWDNRLRPRAENEPLLVDVGDPLQLWKEQIEKFLQNDALDKEEKEKAETFFQKEINIFTNNMQEEEIAEAYMVVGESNKQELEEGDENRVDKKEADSPELNEEIYEASARPTTVISYEKVGTAYQKNLEYMGPSKSYSNTYQVYYHPANFEHLVLELLDRRKAIYLMKYHGFNLVALEPKKLLKLRDWITAGTKQELIRRGYLHDTGIDLGYMELLNIQAIEAERAANQRNKERKNKRDPEIIDELPKRRKTFKEDQDKNSQIGKIQSYIPEMVRSLITLDEIVDDITRSEPVEITPMPPPYNGSHDLANRVSLTCPLLTRSIRLRERINILVYSYYLGAIFAEATPAQKRLLREIVTPYYYTVALKVYDVFVVVGMDQIYHTTRVTYQDLRVLSIDDLKRVNMRSSWNSPLNGGEM